ASAVNELQSALEARIVSERGKALLASIAPRRTEYIALRKRFFDALQMEDYGGAQDLLEKQLAPAAERYSAAQQEMIAAQRALVEQTAAHSSAAVTRQTTLLVVLAVCALALAAFVGWAITRSVTEPLKEAL